MHLIHKHKLSFSCNTNANAKTLHANCADFMNEVFYPQLEILLNKYDVINENWLIQELEVVVNTSYENWQQNLLNQSLYQIEQYLIKTKKDTLYINNKNEEITTNFQSLAFELLMQYLKTNVLAVNTINKNIDEIIKNTYLDATRVNQLLGIFTADVHAMIRWLNLPFTYNKKELYLALLQHSNYTTHKEVVFIWEQLQLLVSNKQTETNQLLFEYLLLLWITDKIDDSDFIINTTKQIMAKFGANSFRLSIKNTAQKNKLTVQHKKILTVQNIITKCLEMDKQGNKQKRLVTPTETEKNTAEPSFNYINNAGLVILYPFLYNFFENLNLIQNNTWINNNALHKAVLLTQYLCTSQTIFWDNELILNKILCGLPVSTIINTKIKLEKNEMEEAENLLKNVIAHWTILKNTSIEGLQTSFFIREGKLKIADTTANELTIASKGIDILLDQLPWSIAIIKTKMMNQPIYCYWNF